MFKAKCFHVGIMLLLLTINQTVADSNNFYVPPISSYTPLATEYTPRYNEDGDLSKKYNANPPSSLLSNFTDDRVQPNQSLENNNTFSYESKYKTYQKMSNFSTLSHSPSPSYSHSPSPSTSPSHIYNVETDLTSINDSATLSSEPSSMIFFNETNSEDNQVDNDETLFDDEKSIASFDVNNHNQWEQHEEDEEKGITIVNVDVDVDSEPMVVQYSNVILPFNYKAEDEILAFEEGEEKLGWDEVMKHRVVSGVLVGFCVVGFGAFIYKVRMNRKKAHNAQLLPRRSIFI